MSVETNSPLARLRVAETTVTATNRRRPEGQRLERVYRDGRRRATRTQQVQTDGVVTTVVIQTAAAITSHRDLIHPQAEIRERIRVDGHSAKAMTVLLGLVLRNLEDAHRSGLLAAYAAI